MVRQDSWGCGVFFSDYVGNWWHKFSVKCLFHSTVCWDFHELLVHDDLRQCSAECILMALIEEEIWLTLAVLALLGVP